MGKLLRQDLDKFDETQKVPVYGCRYHGFTLNTEGICEVCLLLEAEAEVPPLVQDDRALMVIELNAPLIPYPLLNDDRRTVSIFQLSLYLVRLIIWRFKNWKRRRWR